MERKKIVFISGESELRGGGEIFLFDLVRGLKADYCCSCICPGEGSLAAVMRAEGVQVFLSPTGWNRKWKAFIPNYLCLFHLSKLLKKSHPDLIYANAGHVCNLAVRLGKKLHIPVITHIHALFTETRKDKYGFGRSNQLVACSEAVYKLAIRYNPRVKVIYNGIHTQRFSPILRAIGSSIRSALNFSPEEFLIGFVGTIDEKKGIFDFLEMAKIVSKEIPKARFIVAGEPKMGEEELLKKLKASVKAAGLAERFLLLGFVEKIEEVLAGLDVFVSASHFDAFRRVIVEAMSCGVPVVASNCDGSLEIIEDGKNGFLFPTGDVDSMARAVIAINKNPKLAKMAVVQAGLRVERDFAFAKMFAQIESVIYAELNGDSSL